MPPKMGSVEETVLSYINQQNRPLNSQMVADALAQHGIKKAAVQKVMDTLAANGKISYKDYGKQRVCLANQSQFEIPDIDELDAMKKENDQLQADVAVIRSRVSELEAGVKSTESNLTLEAIREKTAKLSSEIEVMESKVDALRGGSVLVTPEERLEVQGTYEHRLGLWRKRKKIYQELWGMITESMTENLKDLKEEIGIETDEDVGCNIKDHSNLGAKKPNRGH
ncbi:homologous-pairing protein 2 homolog isoform X1 [Physcomitrium patens]|uniref:Homologous-pairing protein 2 homolog n=2 Tax=Physcomitrium patens TaxID=3218 RepID=A0A2K1IK90_PHYPA|nr:homologous-pairing protein 2 homolog isoform X1 [Physcomitrium patens]PNR29692.1 hypothetical protein PHYPA_028386 [Physcomitrium patens]|eukprot:XP_024362271.1 homologous-pairing protein 2 homolog isoform X1 [Physcomitrella patens]